MTHVRNWLIILFFLAIYFNIGYGIGHFVYHQIEIPECRAMATGASPELTMFAKILDPFHYYFSVNRINCKEGRMQISDTPDLVGSSFAWPIVIIMIAALWLVKILVLLFKLVFMGGFFKLLAGIS